MYIEAKSHKTAGKMGKLMSRFRSLDKLDGFWQGSPPPFCPMSDKREARTAQITEAGP